MPQDSFEPRYEGYGARMRHSFACQKFMDHLGAELTLVAPGRVEILLPHQAGLTQQNGYFHGGAIGTLADNSGGYASFTLMAAEDAILTVEYKVNMLAPAIGDALLARGQVLRPGRQLTTAESQIFSIKDGKEKLIATALGTFMTIQGVANHAAGI
ncbi:MAG: PaaI family thioesterase [Rhodobacteraceae bacterium]|nr:PaaI family thioesterase [Paracoccaceae bacterium]